MNPFSFESSHGTVLASFCQSYLLTSSNGSAKISEESFYSITREKFTRVMLQDLYLLKDFESGHKRTDHDLPYQSPPWDRSPFIWRSSKREKLILLFSVILPLLTSTALLTTYMTGRVSTGNFLAFTTDHRAPAQIIVSMVAGTLASLNVYTVIKLLNLGARIHLLRHRLSLSMIEFVRAFSTRSVLFDSLATIYSTVAILTLILILPNILWTGALTPVVSNITRVGTDTLNVPRYSDGTTIFGSEYGCRNPDSTLGPVSACPINFLRSSLLIQAGRATSNLMSSHPKNDNTHYSYLGRSFGVGSSAGLLDQGIWAHNATSKLLSYSYHELGYDTGVKCIYNASSQFQLSTVKEPVYEVTTGLPTIYRAGGSFPNATPDDIEDYSFVMSDTTDATIVAMTARHSHGRNYLMITSGEFYAKLNNTQCEATFTPTLFHVEVNVADKVITVHPSASDNSTLPIPPSRDAALFDPGSGLAMTAMNQLRVLGNYGSTISTSDFGNTLAANIGGPVGEGSNLTSSGILSPLADSFVAVMDEILVFNAGNQAITPVGIDEKRGDYSKVPVELTVKCVAVGEGRYIFATFAMCIVLALATLIEATRTRFWRDLPSWDFMHTDSLVYASAVAGSDIVDKMRELRGGLVAKHWTGMTDCQMMSKFQIQLGKKTIKIFPSPEPETRAEGDDEQGLEATDAHLTAVSLWTQGSEVESLV